MVRKYYDAYDVDDLDEIQRLDEEIDRTIGMLKERGFVNLGGFLYNTFLYYSSSTVWVLEVCFWNAGWRIFFDDWIYGGFMTFSWHPLHEKFKQSPPPGNMILSKCLGGMLNIIPKIRILSHEKFCYYFNLASIFIDLYLNINFIYIN